MELGKESRSHVSVTARTSREAVWKKLLSSSALDDQLLALMVPRRRLNLFLLGRKEEKLSVVLQGAKGRA